VKKDTNAQILTPENRYLTHGIPRLRDIETGGTTLSFLVIYFTTGTFAIEAFATEAFAIEAFAIEAFAIEAFAAGVFFI
jgi:hypothetical protein